jgi:outer membrane protein
MPSPSPLRPRNLTLAALLLALPLLFVVAPGGTQPLAGPMRIGVVDVQLVVTQSQAGKAMQATLEARAKELQQNLEARANELRQLTQRITDGQSSLGPEALETLNRERETKSIELRRAQDDAQSEFSKLQQLLLGELEAQVMPVIQKVAEEGAYSMVFRKFDSGLVFAADELDITAEVIRRLDAGAR